jgi:hypothetical protein
VTVTSVVVGGALEPFGEKAIALGFVASVLVVCDASRDVGVTLKMRQRRYQTE